VPLCVCYWCVVRCAPCAASTTATTHHWPPQGGFTFTTVADGAGECKQLVWLGGLDAYNERQGREFPLFHCVCVIGALCTMHCLHHRHTPLVTTRGFYFYHSSWRTVGPALDGPALTKHNPIKAGTRLSLGRRFLCPLRLAPAPVVLYRGLCGLG